jgi:hypothetical protein
MEPQFYRPAVDDATAYREAIRNAEENAVLTDANGEVEQETPVVIAELEGAVAVQASDQPLDTEPAVAETVVETPVVEDTSEQQETLFAGKYKSLEDLEKAHVELQQKLGDPNRLDLENRRLQEQLDALSAKIDEAQAVTPQAPAVQITQELIDNDPQRATLLAFDQKNQGALEIAFEQWKEFDPFTASQWLTDRRLAVQREELEAKIAASQKALDEKTAPLAQQQEEQAQSLAWQQAFDTAKSGRPDFIENAERLLAEVAPLHPSLLPNLQSADPRVKADALIALYAIDKIGNPEAVAAQLGEKAKEAAVDAAAALAAGSVVSGQSTVGQATEEKSDEELEADRYIARMGNKVSLSRGWTGRS